MCKAWYRSFYAQKVSAVEKGKKGGRKGGGISSPYVLSERVREALRATEGRAGAPRSRTRPSFPGQLRKFFCSSGPGTSSHG